MTLILAAVFTIDRITVFEAKLMESGKWRSVVANNPDDLSDKTENVLNQSNDVSNQLPNTIIKKKTLKQSFNLKKNAPCGILPMPLKKFLIPHLPANRQSWINICSRI